MVVRSDNRQSTVPYLGGHLGETAPSRTVDDTGFCQGVHLCGSIQYALNTVTVSLLLRRYDV